VKAFKCLLIIVLCLTIAPLALSQVLGPIQSLREAIEFEWVPPERAFMMGEPMSFDVIAKNTASDSAIVYQLDPAMVRVEAEIPFVLINPAEGNPNDTLAPGQSVRYRYILIDGMSHKHDPFRGVRSYEREVGLPCLPAGEYWLVYNRGWSAGDSLDFTVVEPPTAERPILDSLAQAYVAYQVERHDDAVAMGFTLVEMSAESPLTARGLIFARGVAWENDMCDKALALDSLFWEHFGDVSVRSRYLPFPGVLRATAGVLGKCLEVEERLVRLEVLKAQFPDEEIAREAEHYRNAFTGKLNCPTCP